MPIMLKMSVRPLDSMKSSSPYVTPFSNEMRADCTPPPVGGLRRAPGGRGHDLR
jgi:hypothetical protein